MAIMTNQWSPDTCSCSHLFTWDDSVPASSRVHTHLAAETVCPEHQALGLAGATAYANAVENNQRKNVSIDLARTSVPAVLADNVSWTWDAQRNLTITVSGLSLTTPQRTAIQNALNTRFGAGKVTLG